MGARLIRAIKWVLFIVSLAWAAYYLYALWALSELLAELSRIAGQHEQAASSWTMLDFAGLLVGFGPIVITSILLAVKWPGKGWRLI